MENKENNIEKNSSDVLLGKRELIAFAYDIGFAIIIPLVIFALGGRLLDKKFDTAPIFMLLGLLISLVFTGISIYKKTKKFL